MPSPRPKPTHLKVVAGNPGKRKLNKAEPKPRREIPSCPAHLSDVSKVSWGRLSVMLDRLGVLTEADGLALERLCDCYGEILLHSENIALYGMVYGSTETLLKANPAVGMRADADRRFKGYLIEFGLTPAARTKVQAKTDDEAKDPLAEFFG